MYIYIYVCINVYIYIYMYVYIYIQQNHEQIHGLPHVSQTVGLYSVHFTGHKIRLFWTQIWPKMPPLASLQGTH